MRLTIKEQKQADFYPETTHISRKTQHCCECKYPINPGDQYMSCCWKYDRMFHKKLEHIHCHNFARLICRGGHVPFGQIRHSIKDIPELLYQYKAMLAGINETFSNGSGI